MAGVVSSCLRGSEAERTARDEKHEISAVNDFLFLSGCSGLSSERLLRLGITCAINCIKGIKHNFAEEIEYLAVPVEDEEDQDLTPYFEPIINLIEKHRQQNGKVLVYCGLGISRSATFVIAYLMKSHQMSLLDAYKQVQSRRNIVCPNVGFFAQLLALETELFGRTTVSIIEPAPGIKVPDVVWQEVYDEVVQKIRQSL